MGKPSSKTTPKTTNNKFWKFCNLADSQKAELFLYGDISETSWWGDEVTPKQFADDLAALGDVTEITVYINSGGGDVFAAQAIGNQLARNAATSTACAPVPPPSLPATPTRWWQQRTAPTWSTRSAWGCAGI